MDKLLEIHNLHARIGDKEILRGIDLEIRPGEVHAVMGPNGAGKSTLSAVLTGRPDYEVTEGSILYKGQDLLAMSPEERARRAAAKATATKSAPKPQKQAASVDSSMDEFTKKLKALKMAYENELITEEEFAEAKKHLLELL